MQVRPRTQVQVRAGRERAEPVDVDLDAPLDDAGDEPEDLPLLLEGRTRRRASPAAALADGASARRARPGAPSLWTRPTKCAPSSRVTIGRSLGAGVARGGTWTSVTRRRLASSPRGPSRCAGRRFRSAVTPLPSASTASRRDVAVPDVPSAAPLLSAVGRRRRRRSRVAASAVVSGAPLSAVTPSPSARAPRLCEAARLRRPSRFAGSAPGPRRSSGRAARGDRRCRAPCRRGRRRAASSVISMILPKTTSPTLNAGRSRGSRGGPAAAPSGPCFLRLRGGDPLRPVAPASAVAAVRPRPDRPAPRLRPWRPSSEPRRGAAAPLLSTPAATLRGPPAAPACSGDFSFRRRGAVVLLAVVVPLGRTLVPRLRAVLVLDLRRDARARAARASGCGEGGYFAEARARLPARGPARRGADSELVMAVGFWGAGPEIEGWRCRGREP